MCVCVCVCVCCEHTCFPNDSNLDVVIVDVYLCCSRSNTPSEVFSNGRVVSGYNSLQRSSGRIIRSSGHTHSARGSSSSTLPRLKKNRQRITSDASKEGGGVAMSVKRRRRVSLKHTNEPPTPCTHTHTYIHTYTHTYIHTYTHTYIQSNKHSYIVPSCTYIHKHTFTQIYTH